jgi:hypothetical protein
VSDPNESASTLARKIRQSGPFDVGIFLNESARLSFAIFRARVPLRVGFARGWNSLLCNQHPSPLPMTDIGIVSLHIARSIGANVNVPGLTD